MGPDERCEGGDDDPRTSAGREAGADGRKGRNGGRNKGELKRGWPAKRGARSRGMRMRREDE
jgi:hypothetical protein